MKKVLPFLLSLAGVLAATDARAQMLEWKDRGFVNLSGGFQSGKTDASSTLSFPLYDETATLETARELGSSPLWDVTAGLRVWRNLAVAVSVSGRMANGDAVATTIVPDPVFYDQPRSVEAPITGMKHSELAGSLLAAWVFPVTDQLEFTAMVGPTAVRVSHEAVKGVTITEGTPPTVAVGLETLSKSVWGYTAGLDGRYAITSRFGVGAFLRYSAATANLTSDLKLDVGGLQMGAGLRVRF